MGILQRKSLQKGLIMLQRVKKIAIKVVSILTVIALIIVGMVSFITQNLPDSFTTVADEEFVLQSMPFVTADIPYQELSQASTGESNSYNVQLSLLGMLPIKTVRLVETQRQTLTVMGEPFGIKMFADGVMVVGFSDIKSSTGYKNPARLAGLQLGDVIKSIAGEDMVVNEDVNHAISQSKGEPTEIIYMRDDEERSCIITAVEDSTTGSYRSGMWVRDSSAGIGTLTFADNEEMIFGGLGHPVSDTDTGKMIELLSGEIVPVIINGAIEADAGSAGELKGEFISDDVMGEVLQNDQTGVYGRLNVPLEGREYEVATPAETVTGTATIIATVDEEGPKSYRIEIERLFLGTDNFTKNMLIRVTDQELLEKTGGIVQGMSGSPIIQNGRIVGAVTHVLVNDPTKGYGIFIENMLESAESITE